MEYNLGDIVKYLGKEMAIVGYHKRNNQVAYLLFSKNPREVKEATESELELLNKRVFGDNQNG